MTTAQALKKFIVLKRMSGRETLFCDQFVVLDQISQKWTPMAMFPKIAQEYADALNNYEKDVVDFKWYPNDGLWDINYVGPNKVKFEI